MPWTKSDVNKYKSGLTDAQKEKWVSTANSVLRQCLKKGGKQSNCEAKAIRIANSRTKSSESMDVLKTLNDLREVGRVVSKANEKKIKDAITALQDILSRVAKSESVQPGEIREAVEEANELIEAERSYNELNSLLRQGLKQVYLNDEYGPFLEDFTDTWLVYKRDMDLTDKNVAGKLFRADYQLNNGKLTLSNIAEVYRKITFEPMQTESTQESQREDNSQDDEEGTNNQDPQKNLPFVEDKHLEEQPVKLIEKQNQDGSIPIKIIGPGWGSSGYYSKETLSKDAGAYKSGTQMYWDHPTQSEESDRPERSLRDLAGVLVSDGRYEENGPAGPGVYADAKPFSAFKDAIDEMKGHIGVSHRALGKATQGEAEGKKGNIITNINDAISVDFVTMPGAGGQVVEMFESYRNTNTQNNATMNQNESNNNSESQGNTQVDQRLKERLLLYEAKDHLVEKLGSVNLPEITKQRLKNDLAKQAPMTESGELDTETFNSLIDEAVKEEANYIANLTGSGQIKGLGESKGTNKGSQDDEEAVKERRERISRNFQRMGLKKESADQIANR